MGRAMRNKKMPTAGRAGSVSAIAAASKTRRALPAKKNQENISRYFSKEKDKLLQKLEEKHNMRRNVLSDKTNDVVPLRGMSLRRRSDLLDASPSPGNTSTSSPSASFSGRVLRCPTKTPPTDKPLATESAHHVEKGSQKKCVYKQATVTACETKPLQDMSPGEKLKLYEFQVDKNEPKRVKKTRKRKIKKRKVVTADSSDDSCSMGQVVKRLRCLEPQTLITSALTTTVDSTAAATNSPLLFLPKCATDNLNTSVSKRMTDSVDTSVTKRAHFATNSGATNSTPQFLDHHVNKLRSRYREIMSSPDSSPIATCNTTGDDSCTSSGDVDMSRPPPSHGQLEQDKVQSVLTPVQQGRNDCSKASNVSRCSASENVSLRLSVLERVMPRVSSLVPRNVSLDLPSELNVSNCFGFDDAEELDLEPVKRPNKTRIAIPRQRRLPAPAPLPTPFNTPSMTRC